MNNNHNISKFEEFKNELATQQNYLIELESQVHNKNDFDDDNSNNNSDSIKINTYQDEYKTNEIIKWYCPISGCPKHRKAFAGYKTKDGFLGHIRKHLTEDINIIPAQFFVKHKKKYCVTCQKLFKSDSNKHSGHEIFPVQSNKIDKYVYNVHQHIINNPDINNNNDSNNNNNVDNNRNDNNTNNNNNNNDNINDIDSSNFTLNSEHDNDTHHNIDAGVILDDVDNKSDVLAQGPEQEDITFDLNFRRDSDINNFIKFMVSAKIRSFNTLPVKLINSIAAIVIKMINDILYNGHIRDWARFICFWKYIACTNKRSGRKARDSNLNRLKRKLENWDNVSDNFIWVNSFYEWMTEYNNNKNNNKNNARSSRNSNNSSNIDENGNKLLTKKEKRNVESYIRDGRYSKAMKYINSYGLAADTTATYNKMKELFPANHSNYNKPLNWFNTKSLKLDVDTVMDIVKSAKASDCAGFDSIKPIYLKQLFQCESGNDVAEAFTKLFNNIIKGDTNELARKWFTTTTTIPLNKDKSGIKIRPIAVASSMRRICSRAINMLIKDKINSTCWPLSIGMHHTPATELIIHSVNVAAKTIEQQKLNDKCILLMDIKNAYNSLNRDIILKAVEKYCPELLDYIYFLYGSTNTSYLYNHRLIYSVCGFDQGAPLSNLLCTLSVYYIFKVNKIDTSKVDFISYYVDDGTIIGNLKDVAELLTKIRAAFQNAGWIMHDRKTTVYARSNIPNDVTFNNTIVIQPHSFKFELLGSIIANKSETCEYLDRELNKVNTNFKLINQINSIQHQWLLFYYCNNFTRQNYICRTVEPSKMKDYCNNVELINYNWIENMLGVVVSWNRFRLIEMSFRMGGLNIKAPKHINIAGFASSFCIASDSINKLIQFKDPVAHTVLIGVKNDILNRITNSMNKYGNKNNKYDAYMDQKKNTTQIENDIIISIRNNLITTPSKLRWISNTNSKSASFSYAIPNNYNEMNDDTFRYAICSRYNLHINANTDNINNNNDNNLNNYRTCKRCNKNIIVSCMHDHALTCRGNMYGRHNVIRNYVHALCKKAGLASQLEVDIFQTGHVRSADILVTNFQCGNTTAIDVAITHAVQPKLYPRVKEYFDDKIDGSFITKHYELFKFDQYNDNKNKFGVDKKCVFAPFILASNGATGVQAELILKRIAALLVSKWRTRYAYIKASITQSLCCKVITSNYKMYKRCFL